MKTRFQVPPQQTLVKFGPRLPPLGLVLLDAGVPWDGAPRGDHVFRVAGGEGSKRWAELERILIWLASRRVERATPLVVIGGGATLDLGALAASLYRRGMPVILVPTTLLGMVDATLGGKTGVDLELDGKLLKNFAGTFHPASEVWISTAFLRTLPIRERVSGAGEVLKTMWIRGGKWNRRALAAFVKDARVTPALARLVRDCLAVKAKLVARDPLDTKRVRELLNFGHTAGHAIESGSGLSHGECVLWGMAIESRLAGAAAMEKECLGAIRELGLSQGWAEADWEALLGADKKAKKGLIEMSLLRAPGKPFRVKHKAADVARAIREFRA